MTVQASLIFSIVMGSISLVLSLFYTFPQLYSMCKTRNTSGVSVTTYIIHLLTSCLWTAWAFGLFFQSANSYNPNKGLVELYRWSLIPALILNFVDVVLICFVLTWKIFNIFACKKLQVNEISLAKQRNQQINGLFARYWLFFVAIFLALAVVTTSCLICCLYVFKDNGASYKWIFPIGLIASITWEAVNWPQLIKTIRVKDTTGISLFWTIFMAVSCIVTFLYDISLGIINGNWIDLLPALICSGIIPSIIEMVLKINNVVKAKKLGLSELEYTKKYLI